MKNTNVIELNTKAWRFEVSWTNGRTDEHVLRTAPVTGYIYIPAVLAFFLLFGPGAYLLGARRKRRRGVFGPHKVLDPPPLGTPAWPVLHGEPRKSTGESATSIYIYIYICVRAVPDRGFREWLYYGRGKSEDPRLGMFVPS